MLLRALGRGVVGVVVGAEFATGVDSAGWTSSFFSTAGVAQVGTDHWKPVNDLSWKPALDHFLHGFPVRSKALNCALIAPWLAFGPNLCGPLVPGIARVGTVPLSTFCFFLPGFPGGAPGCRPLFGPGFAPDTPAAPVATTDCASDPTADPTGDPAWGVALAARGEEFLAEFADDSVILLVFEGETVAASFAVAAGAHLANFAESILRTTILRGRTAFLSIFFGGIVGVFAEDVLSEEEEVSGLVEETAERTMLLVGEGLVV